MNLTPASRSSGAPPWVYVFSQFTSEALLFESLFMLILISAYAAFWVVKKRRYGTAGPTLPSGPIKTYLNELIAQAEHLRLQLFGLLSASSPSIPYSPLPVAPTLAAPTSDPLLEARVAELTRALDASNLEKTALEVEVQKLKATATSQEGNVAKNNTQSDEMVRMEQKVQALEDKLAEYSIIEDDLANLKRFQQENVKLKAFIQEKGHELPNMAGLPAAVPTTRKEPVASPSADSSGPELASAPVIPSDDAVEPAEGGFGGLAGKMGESLNIPFEGDTQEPTQPEEKSAGGSESDDPLARLGSLAAAAEAQGENADPAALQKSEEDLVKEFEKMLKD